MLFDVEITDQDGTTSTVKGLTQQKFNDLVISYSSPEEPEVKPRINVTKITVEED